jgi:hypothetical protein
MTRIKPAVKSGAASLSRMPVSSHPGDHMKALASLLLTVPLPFAPAAPGMK